MLDLLVPLLLVAAAPALPAQVAADVVVQHDEAATDELQVVDRLVAVVDDDPIFLSDVDRLLALGLAGAPDGSLDERRRQALDRLVEQRLRLHEVERYEIGTVRDAEVDAQVEALEASLGGDAALDRLLAEQSMDREALRSLLRRQLRILAYVEERLAPRVVVSDEEIRSYHDGTLRREMEQRGEALPPLDEVREAVRGVLLERGLNREIESWTDELRARADIVEQLGRRQLDLPPIALRLDS